MVISECNKAEQWLRERPNCRIHYLKMLIQSSLRVKSREKLSLLMPLPRTIFCASDGNISYGIRVILRLFPIVFSYPGYSAYPAVSSLRQDHVAYLGINSRS
ncbi:hypothetical protein ACH5RR_014845 [Cinchona calisaya]|uniref:Uncharacterized protein n=1 Tax=Cinchona calisaya TaxID=153742 RepID=A0ABD2ZT39_9GENT